MSSITPAERFTKLLEKLPNGQHIGFALQFREGSLCQTNIVDFLTGTPDVTALAHDADLDVIFVTCTPGLLLDVFTDVDFAAALEEGRLEHTVQLPVLDERLPQ